MISTASVRRIVSSAVTLICFSGGSLFADQALRAAGAFDIRASIPADIRPSDVHVHKLVARNGSLYFLISGGPSADDCILLQTDLYGGYKSAIKLGYGTVRDVDIDDHGSSYVLFGYPDDHTVVYNAKGDKIDDQPSRGASKVAFIKDLGLSHIYFDGHLTARAGKANRRLAAALKPLATPGANTPTRTTYVALPQQKLMMIEGVTATLQVSDITTGTTAFAPISSPDVDRARQYYSETITDPNLRGVIVIAAASGDNDTLYMLLSAYKDSDGAIIIQTDDRGNVLRTFRCALPPDALHNRGKLLPSDIAVAEGELFIAAASGTVAAYYLEE